MLIRRRARKSRTPAFLHSENKNEIWLFTRELEILG